MFDVGFGELLLIGLVALLVLGPERLPGAARTAGRLLGKLRKSWSDVRAEVERELKAEELKRQVNEAVMEGRRAAEGLGEEARKHVDDIIRGVQPDVAAKPTPDDGTDTADGDQERDDDER